MKTCLSLILFSGYVLSAQTPNLSGVWKANLEKSKITGPPPASYLVIIDQQGSKVSLTSATFSPRGEQRASLAYNTDGKPSMTSFRGLPMRTNASWNGETLVAESKIAGPRPASMIEKYTLSPDGKTLTVDTVTTVNGKDIQQTMWLEKQPDSAGEPLHKPEQTAGARFKNVLVMKDAPASQFLDAMRYFTMALGTDCEHCHVQNNFAADDKPAKPMARKMLTMTHSINEQTFGGKLEVRCYTCHRGQVNPQSRPAF